MTLSDTPDVIDALAGVRPGSRLDGIRAQRPQARRQAQASFRALFAPATPGGVSVVERFAVATFVAGLVEREAEAGAAEGPYGAYPPGPLSPEDREGPVFRVSPESRSRLGPRLAAALDHAHLLTLHPRDAAPEALQALLDAGLSTTDIVTLSQLVAFLTFQIRVVEGLRVLGATEGEAA